MLDAIFGSELRVKAINQFLLNPDKKYQAPSLAKEIGFNPAPVRHELESLAAFGLLKESLPEDKYLEETGEPIENTEKEQKKKGGKKSVPNKAYQLDKEFIIYPEIRALFTKSQLLFSRRFIDNLKKICQPKLLALTGIFTNNEDSLTDILIVGQVRRPAFVKLLAELEKDLGREINFTILSEAEYRYRQEIMDIFLYNLLEGKTLLLIDELSDSKEA